MSNSVFSIKEYGKVDVRLKEIMDKNGITRSQMATMCHTRFEVIDKWYNNNVEKMDLDILARICFVLECSPSDLLVYRAETDNK